MTHTFNSSKHALFWASAESWLSQIISLAVVFLLARHLDAESFGLMAMVLIVTDLAIILVTQGVVDFLVQKSDIKPVHYHTAFWLNMGIASLTMSFTLVFSEKIALLFNAPTLSSLFPWSLWILIFQGSCVVQESVLKRNMDFQPLAIRQCTGTLAGGCIGLIAAMNDCGVYSLVYQQITRSAVSTLCLWHLGGWKPELSFSREAARELFTYSWHLLGTQLSSFITKKGCEFLIGLFLGASALGLFNISQRIVMMGSRAFLVVSAKVALPLFSKYKGRENELRQKYYKSATIGAFIICPFFLILSSASDAIVALGLGTVWAPCGPIVRFLALGSAIQILYICNNNLLKAHGRSDRLLVFGLGMMALNIFSALIAIPYGINAVAFSIMLVAYLLFPLSFLLAKKTLPFDTKTYAKNLMPVVAGSIIACLFTMPLQDWIPKEHALFSLASITTVWLFTYLMVILIINRSLVIETFHFLKETLLSYNQNLGTRKRQI